MKVRREGSERRGKKKKATEKARVRAARPGHDCSELTLIADRVENMKPDVHINQEPQILHPCIHPSIYLSIYLSNFPSFCLLSVSDLLKE
jgi:hypothetical protein